MTLPRVRFTIRGLMIVVAAVGALSALFSKLELNGIEMLIAFSFIIGPPLIATLLVSVFVRPGRRCLVGTWIAAAWPLSIPISLHAAWVAAYCSIGHPPGPLDNGWVENLGSELVLAFILQSLASPLILAICLWMTPGTSWTDERLDVWACPVLMEILVWSMVVLSWNWDPFQAVWWILD